MVVLLLGPHLAVWKMRLAAWVVWWGRITTTTTTTRRRKVKLIKTAGCCCWVKWFWELGAFFSAAAPAPDASLPASHVCFLQIKN